MRIFHFIISLSLLLNISAAFAADTENKPLLLTGAHAHNDYVHTRPLFDALDQGFCSVEADIFLRNGNLLVAHESNHLAPEKTLQALYLDPLRERVRKNHGRVYPDGPEFTLLVDMKEDWQALYPALRTVLTNYADILTTFQNGVEQTNAILVIISGNRDLKMFDGETVRYAAFDGEIADLGQHRPDTLIPWISANWKTQFSWKGKGIMPAAEALKLQTLVSQAHAEHYRLRFWGAPDNPVFWKALTAASVDLINTDDLAGVQDFFKESSSN